LTSPCRDGERQRFQGGDDREYTLHRRARPGKDDRAPARPCELRQVDQRGDSGSIHERDVGEIKGDDAAAVGHDFPASASERVTPADVEIATQRRATA
jgi:hypothetical protein